MSTKIESHNITSSIAKKIERNKAKEALKKAKSIPRKVVFLKMGDDQFARELQDKRNPPELLISRSAAEYLNMSYHAFARKVKNVKIPFTVKKGTNKYFKISDLEKFKKQLTNA
ncbi:hypothetical protein [Chryseobacterium sp.]|uniref:hypothetical protein n=1 Tax=Chryseobacterium sp. TaxID=1871047 RepID=UPI0028A24884|nr:hypothetical protein [Chryseobacterium sp.]